MKPALCSLAGCGLAVVASFPGLISAQHAAPHSIQAQHTLTRLDLVSRHDVPTLEMKSTARDIRWASKSSVFIAYDGDGVLEFSLREPLARGSELFPPRSRPGASSVPNIHNLAFDGRHLLAWGPANVVGWRDVALGSGITIKKLPGYFDDVDVRGDLVAIIGYPNIDQYVSSDHAYLWLGDLRSGLDEWRPLRELSLPAGVKARSTFGRFLGSIRFLENGDLLVVPVVKPGVFRHAQSGKQKASWSSQELESSLLSAIGEHAERGDGEEEVEYSRTEPELNPSRILEQVASLRLVIEDVLPIRKSPAVVVRFRTGGASAFFLGILEPELAWYSLPIGDHHPAVRVRADYSKNSGQIALLVTDRYVASEDTKRTVYIVSAP